MKNYEKNNEKLWKTMKNTEKEGQQLGLSRTIMAFLSFPPFGFSSNSKVSGRCLGCPFKQEICQFIWSSGPSQDDERNYFEKDFSPLNELKRANIFLQHNKKNL